MHAQALSKSCIHLILLVGFWLSIVVAGLLVIGNYETTPGPTGVTPSHWPVDSRVPLGKLKSTIILFAHPRCPCSRASIAEFSILLSHCKDRVRPHVLFFKPREGSDEWKSSEQIEMAVVIPEVKVDFDDGGIEARRFGAVVSGHVVLYSADGRCLYSGGITGSRGHRGDSKGRAAVEQLVNSGGLDPKKLPVFGCLLCGNQQLGKEGSPCR